MQFDDYEGYDLDVDLINDLATNSNASYAGVYYATTSDASPVTLSTIHEDIQSLHWSVVCIYVVCMFCWICKQWG